MLRNNYLPDFQRRTKIRTWIMDEVLHKKVNIFMDVLDSGNNKPIRVVPVSSIEPSLTVLLKLNSY
jgi:hypothetical protein